MKKVLKGLGVAAAAGVGISMVRAATTYKAKPVEAGEQLAPEKVDVDRFINNLSRAIQIPTICNVDESVVDWSKFDEFHAFLKEAYPLIHENLELEIISKTECSHPSNPSEPKITPGRFLTLSGPSNF